MMKTNWIGILDGFCKIAWWSLLFWNLWLERIDYALVYAIVIIAWSLDDIATNTRVKKDE